LICTRCELCWKTKHVKTLPCGSPGAPVLFIADWPFRDTDYTLNGREQELLREITTKAELRFPYEATYAVKCWPGFRKGKPKKATKGHFRACSSYLFEELKNRRLVVACGANVLSWLLPNEKKLEDARGKLLDHPAGFKVFVTYSLRFLLVNPDYKINAIQDLRDCQQFLGTGRIEVRKLSKDVVIAGTREEVVEALQKASQAPHVASDVETRNGDKPGYRWPDSDFTVSHYGAAWSPNDAVVFDPRTYPDLYQEFLRLQQVVHNASFEGNIYPRREGLIKADTLCLAHLVNPLDHLSLESVTRKYLKQPPWKGREETWDDWAARCGIDVCNTFELHQILWDKLDAKRRRLHDWVTLPAAIILGSFFGKPMRLSKANQERLDAAYEERKSLLSREAYSRWGFIGNLNSTVQVGKFLYEKLGIPVPTKAFDEEGQHSTADEFLAEIALGCDFADVVRKYRAIIKRQSNYIYRDKNGFRDSVELVFRICGTVTGRPAADHFQTIATDKEVRENYIPDEGYEFLCADFSQGELRIGGAILAGDPTMVDAYQNGKDLHAITCTEVLKQELNEKNRYEAKPPNFLLLFGGKAEVFRVAALKAYGIRWTKEQATEIRESWMAKYHGIPKWHLANRQQICCYGQITGPTGRVYPIAQGLSFDPKEVDDGNKKANNYPCQGSLSDCNLLMVVEADKLLPGCVRYTMHDEGGFQVPPKDTLEFAKELDRRTSARLQEFWPVEERRGIDLPREYKRGPSLGNLEKIKV